VRDNTYLANVVFGHAAGHIALVFEDEEGGSHQTLEDVSRQQRMDGKRWNGILLAPASP